MLTETNMLRPARRHSSAWRHALLEDEPPDLRDQPRLLGDRDEVGGADHAPEWVLPPHERFASDRDSALERDDGLVLNAELLSADRATQLVLGRHP